jgi:hypothetical protein
MDVRDVVGWPLRAAHVSAAPHSPPGDLTCVHATLRRAPNAAAMYTHNAPGPYPKPLPVPAHVFRGLLQILLVSTYLQIAMGA